MMQSGWFIISGLALACGVVWLVVSGWFGAQLLSQLLPLLADTTHQVQDLGDLAANTVGRASETMDLIEVRVSDTVGQAAQGGTAATNSVMRVGAAIAGIYMASRFVSLLRGNKTKRGRSVRRRGRRR